MTGRFLPRLDILPRAQQELLPQLNPAYALGLVLYGGTAIALRLGHRQSVDFDFFSAAALDHDLLRQSFPFMSGAKVLQDRPNALTVLVAPDGQRGQTVKVSFFGTIGFGRVGEPDLTNDGVLWVASLRDLMATKLKVILQRPEAKDYRDIAAMLGAKVDLAQGLADARAMFGPAFQPSESLRALSFFGDGDLHTLASADKQGLISAASGVRDLPQGNLLSPALVPA